MPNALAHRIGAGLVLAGATAYIEKQDGEVTGQTLLAGAGGFAFGTLPDLIEPALHPNHRQFFHSFLVLGSVGYGLKKLYDWEPETEGQQLLRGILLVVGGAYGVHLVMDALTKRSLPLV